MEKDWKDKLRFAYSTNPEYSSESDDQPESPEIPIPKQRLIVAKEKKHRGGKTVTIVRGIVGTDEFRSDLCKTIKTRCGVGGSVKDGEIIIQGDIKEKVASILGEMGYKTKISG